MPSAPNDRHRWLSAGLFLATLATLLLENLDSRLLSVLTWYHLSFFAVSLAMLGMAAGAVLVFLGGARFHGASARTWLGRASLAFALSIPLSHVASLYLPFPTFEAITAAAMGQLALAAAVLGVPFLLSGVVVTVALTRVGGMIGRLYAADLLGAAAGCLLIIPLLNTRDITSAALLTGAVAAAATWCFERFAGRGRGRGGAVVALLLVAAGLLNAPPQRGIGVVAAKGVRLPREAIDRALWNSHSYIIALKASLQPAFYWGAGKGSRAFKATSAAMMIDGAAGTVATQWDGDVANLDWTRYDLTYLPYHVRAGDVAIIGVGGGRDILAALTARSTSITAIEINGIFVDLLDGPYRDFTRLVERPEVHLVHDEGRSYLTRAGRQFDVIQMSLVDTWAATSAGAFSLSENGLYTLQAWKVFLAALKPDGLLSVSRWFNPAAVSETNRLLALGVAALLERGVARPADHLVLAARDKVATLLVSPSPLSEADRARLREAIGRYGFTELVAPWAPPAQPRMGAIVAATTPATLQAAVADPLYDYSPPTDDRPYFFNILRPSRFADRSATDAGGVIVGNLRATTTLVALLAVAAVLVAAIIIGPLVLSGLPAMSGRQLAWALAYFAAIGAGFMFIQIAFVQRFSIFLGHPTYTLAVILFSMIFFTGIGSWLSDAIDIASGRGILAIPIAITTAVLLVLAGLQPLIDTAIHLGLGVKSLIVVLVAAPLSVGLGLCFPIGLRLVRRHSEDATAWMWGVNGACGVLGSIIAVAVSMWLGIHVNLLLAALLYAALILPMRALQR